MTRPYSPYGTTSTEGNGEQPPQPGHYDPDSSFRSRYRSSYGSGDYRSSYGSSDYRSGRDGARDTSHDSGYEDYDAYVGEDHDDDSDDDIYEYYEPVDRRWVWVASVAGVILLVAVICTVIILGGGDSGSVSATLTSPAAPTPTSQPTTTPAQDAISTPAPPPPGPSMSPETVTTLTPAPRATAAPTPEPAPPVEPAPPDAAVVSPSTITYTVTGTRPLVDLVTIVYTDQRGALQTDINVALPWTKTVTLDPGVQLKSVTATSVAGQLNCSITDANGAVLVQQANNTMITTCTQ